MRAFGWGVEENFRRHDVHEFMRVLIGILEGAMSPTSRPAAAAAAPAAAAVAASVDASTPSAVAAPASSLASLFTGRFLDQIECDSCHSKRSRSDPFQDLSLPVKGFASLEDSLANFIAVERMDGDSKMRCDSAQCGGAKQNGSKQLLLESLPELLTFHLRRVDNNLFSLSLRRVNDAFAFPHELDMTRFVKGASSLQQQSCLYEVSAILMHSGAQNGHYFTYAQSLADHQWYCFDDADVSPLTLENTLRAARGGGVKADAAAYMLLYRRVQSAESSASAAADHIDEVVRAIIAREEAGHEEPPPR